MHLKLHQFKIKCHHLRRQTLFDYKSLSLPGNINNCPKYRCYELNLFFWSLARRKLEASWRRSINHRHTRFISRYLLKVLQLEYIICAQNTHCECETSLWYTRLNSRFMRSVQYTAGLQNGYINEIRIKHVIAIMFYK